MRVTSVAGNAPKSALGQSERGRIKSERTTVAEQRHRMLKIRKLNAEIMSRRRKHVKIQNETAKKIKKEPDAQPKVR